jgi:hypothetical protein
MSSYSCGASQSGKIVNVLSHRRHISCRIHTRSCLSSWACRTRLPWPMIVASSQTENNRGSRSKGTTRIYVVFRIRQCGNQNQAGVKNRRGPSLLNLLSAGCPSHSANQFRTKLMTGSHPEVIQLSVERAIRTVATGRTGDREPRSGSLRCALAVVAGCWPTCRD